MKKRRLFILISAMLICIALVGCSVNTDDLVENTEITEIKTKSINATVVSKFNEKEIIVYSDTSCFFNLTVSILDENTKSENTYKDFEISKGETITLTIDDLAPDFFSEEAIITYVSPIHPYVYTDSSLNLDNYKSSNCQLLMKYSSKEITVYSDKSCFFDLSISTEGDNFNSKNEYRKIEIKKGETITLTLNDLVPGFFTNKTSIKYVNPYIETYIHYIHLYILNFPIFSGFFDFYDLLNNIQL